MNENIDNFKYTVGFERFMQRALGPKFGEKYYLNDEASMRAMEIMNKENDLRMAQLQESYNNKSVLDTRVDRVMAANSKRDWNVKTNVDKAQPQKYNNTIPWSLLGLTVAALGLVVYLHSTGVYAAEFNDDGHELPSQPSMGPKTDFGFNP